MAVIGPPGAAGGRVGAGAPRTRPRPSALSAARFAGPAAAQGRGRHRPGRGAQGGDGLQPARRAVQRAGHPAGRQHRLPVPVTDRHGTAVSERKSILLRLDPPVHDALARWAADELRSTNTQIEFLLRRALADAGRLPTRVGRCAGPADRHAPARLANHRSRSQRISRQVVKLLPAEPRASPMLKALEAAGQDVAGHPARPGVSRSGATASGHMRPRKARSQPCPKSADVVAAPPKFAEVNKVMRSNLASAASAVRARPVPLPPGHPWGTEGQAATPMSRIKSHHVLG